ELMLCRFASVLKRLGAKRVSILCREEVVSMISTLQAADLVLSHKQKSLLPAHDYWVFPFSIPAYYSLEKHGIPATCPYLTIEPQKVAQWQRYLPERQKGVLNIGLIWKGNPYHENDHFRSVAHLSLLSVILQLPGIQWVSLQKGESEQEWHACTEQRALPDETDNPCAGYKTPLHFAPILLGNKIDDFSDTAAIMHSLDLIISVDTATAHLAGALAKPVWLLLPTCLDWRWQSNRQDSPWYPGMRLFRQLVHKNWHHPLVAMKETLEFCIQNKKSLL
ncbi:MAG: glycosyltransferase family 9 protein, partial [Enterobacteriaceae bacterium]